MMSLYSLSLFSLALLFLQIGPRRGGKGDRSDKVHGEARPVDEVRGGGRGGTQRFATVLRGAVGLGGRRRYGRFRIQVRDRHDS
jgi:hypothetical protein